MGGDESLQLLGRGANDFTDLLPILEGQESGHGANAHFFRDVLSRINIYLVKIDGRGFLREGLEDGADHSAWAAPICPKVKDGDLVPGDDFPELSERANCLDGHDDLDG